MQQEDLLAVVETINYEIRDTPTPTIVPEVHTAPIGHLLGDCSSIAGRLTQFETLFAQGLVSQRVFHKKQAEISGCPKEQKKIRINCTKHANISNLITLR